MPKPESDSPNLSFLATDDPASPSSEASASASSAEVRFHDEALAEKLDAASESELNAADFGIIAVDDDGVILFYNEAEADLSGMRPDEVVGRNFFTQVAPCTNNRLFRGRFEKGVEAGTMDKTFSYTYTYKMHPTLVNIRLCRDAGGTNWILVEEYGESGGSNPS